MSVPDADQDPFLDLALAAHLAEQEYQALRRRRRWQAIGVVLMIMVIVTLISL